MSYKSRNFMIPNDTVREFMHTTMHSHTQHPMPIIALTDPEFLDSEIRYRVYLDNTDGSSALVLAEALSDGSNAVGIAHAVSLEDKSVAQIVNELNASPFRIKAKAVASIKNIAAENLIINGNVIPNSFPVVDRSIDGHSVFIRAKRWSVHYDKLSAISLDGPAFDSIKKRWWPRIVKGSFSTRGADGHLYEFGVPEYDNQTWSSAYGRPFVDVPGEAPIFKESKILQLSAGPLLALNNILIRATSQQDKFFPAEWIKDVDIFNSRIYLQDGITFPDNIEVFYSYLERGYVYKDINVNAHFKQNPYLMNKFVVLYARPIKSSAGVQRDRGIYHEVGHTLDQAIYSIKSTNADEPIAILGALAIRPVLDRANISVLDTRSYGGGLHENELGVSYEERFETSEYFTDIGRLEGIPYGGSASILMELPPELKEVMTVEELRTKVKRFVAAGVYPVIKFDEESYEKKFYSSSYSSDISFFDPLKFAQPHHVHNIKPGYTGSVDRHNHCSHSEDIDGSNNSATSWMYGCSNNISGDRSSLALTLDYSVANPDGSTPAYYVGNSQNNVDIDGPEGCIRKQFFRPEDAGLGETYGHYSYYTNDAWKYNPDGTLNTDTYLGKSGQAVGPGGTLEDIQMFSCYMKRSGESGVTTNFSGFSTHYVGIQIQDRLERVTTASVQMGYRAVFKWTGVVPELYDTYYLESGAAGAVDAGNGWYRFYMSWTGNNLTGQKIVGGNSNIAWPDTDIGDMRNYMIYPSQGKRQGAEAELTTLNNSGCYVWGAQLETSHIVSDYQPVYGEPWDVRTLGYMDTSMNWLDTSLTLPPSGIVGAVSWQPSNVPPESNEWEYPNYPDLYYNVSSLKQGATMSGDHLVLEGGKSYEHVYLRSSANPTFSWEECTDGTLWTRKTYKDTKNVEPFTLATSKVSITARHGRKYIKKIRGGAVFHKNNIEDDTFVDDLTREVAQIWINTKAISSGSIGATTHYISNIANGSTTKRQDKLGDSSTPASSTYSTFQHDAALNQYSNQFVDQAYKPFLENHDTFTTIDLYTNDVDLSAAAYLIYNATTGEHNEFFPTGTFPRVYDMSTEDFVDDGNYDDSRMYDAIHDIYTYSTFLKERINYHSSISVRDNSPAYIISTGTGGTEWIQGLGDTMATYTHSGVENIADRVRIIHTLPGGDNLYDYQNGLTGTVPTLDSRDVNSILYGPYYDAKENTEFKIRTGALPSESATDITENYLNFDYVKSFASLYASQISPTTGDFDVCATGASSTASGDYVDLLSFQPRDVAISGMLTANQYFKAYYQRPQFSGNTAAAGSRQFSTTWLHDCNTISRYGAKYLDNICEAFEDIYFSNSQWGGWLYSSSGQQAVEKDSPYYSSTESPTDFYKTDMVLNDQTNARINWISPGTGVSELTYSGALSATLSGLYKNMELMRPTIHAATSLGGILEPGYVKAVRKYLWFPYYSGQGLDLWNDTHNEMLAGANFDIFVDTFELGMGAILRGAISEEGIVTEGGSFRHQPAPLRTTLPSELFKACADAIKYYDSINDTDNKTRWTCLAEGLFRTTTGNYKLVGGYPDTVIFNRQSAVGNPGYIPVDGLMYLLNTVQTESFSSDKKLMLTGDIGKTIKDIDS
jgi:hypothetical protein